MVEALLQQGADVCAQDSQGHTAIHRAVLLGHDGVVEVLLTGMEQKRSAAPTHPLRHKPTGELAAAALEKALDGKSLNDD